MRKTLSLLAFFAVICVGVGADVVFSNFGSGDTFDLSQGWGVSGPTSLFGVEWDQAAAFTPWGDFFLGEVDVAITNTSGTAQIDVIVADDNAGVPGNILDQTSVTAPGAATIVTATFSGTVPLTTGQQYWVWLSAPDDGLSSWYWNVMGDVDLRAMGTNLSSGGSWAASTGNARSAFRVEGAILVPEPGTFVLLGLGAVGMVLYRRRKQS